MTTQSEIDRKGGLRHAEFDAVNRDRLTFQPIVAFLPTLSAPRMPY